MFQFIIPASFEAKVRHTCPSILFRCDSSNAYYGGDGNPNAIVLRPLQLLERTVPFKYAVDRPGFCDGISDGKETVAEGSMELCWTEHLSARKMELSYVYKDDEW